MLAVWSHVVSLPLTPTSAVCFSAGCFQAFHTFDSVFLILDTGSGFQGSSKASCSMQTLLSFVCNYVSPCRQRNKKVGSIHSTQYKWGDAKISLQIHPYHTYAEQFSPELCVICWSGVVVQLLFVLAHKIVCEHARSCSVSFRKRVYQHYKVFLYFRIL